MRIYVEVAVSSLLILLSGCASKIDVVNEEMATIDKEPALQIEKLPEFHSVPNFQYAAQHLRSPFLPPSIANELKMKGAAQLVRPNTKRKIEALEHYPLETLQMKGSILTKEGEPIALVQTPDGEIERIGIHQYIGLNHGRTLKITQTEIDLVELVSNGTGGYVERPRKLQLIQPKE